MKNVKRFELSSNLETTKKGKDSPINPMQNGIKSKMLLACQLFFHK